MAKPRDSSVAPSGDSRPLDALDRRIIAELQEDGRRSFRAIARTLSISEGTVRYRVNRLQELGVMSVTAFAHPEPLGQGILATVFVRIASPQLEQLIGELRSWPEVMYLASVAGERDLMLQVVAANLEALHELVSARLALLPGVRDTETIVELKIHKAHYEFPRVEPPDRP